jgi:hypothetical protein
VASLIQVPLAFLHRPCFAGGYVKRVFGCLALYLVFLGRRLSVWRRSTQPDPLSESDSIRTLVSFVFALPLAPTLEVVAGKSEFGV